MTAVSHPVLPAGYRCLSLGTVDSTNAEAARLAATGETGPLWIVAASQTGGRGRYGRHWASPSGNLYATLLIALSPSPERSANLSFVAALALFDAASACLPVVKRASLALKWPNDLLIDGAKTSGLLLDRVGGCGDRTVLAVGFGVNIAHAPADIPYAATSLGAHGASVTPMELLEHLASAFARWLSVWNGGAGFADIRAAWLERAANLGRPIRLSTATETFCGVFEGLGEDGALLMSGKDGSIRRILAGDVFFTSEGATGPAR